MSWLVQDWIHQSILHLATTLGSDCGGGNGNVSEINNLLATAWTLIVENFDVVRWLACGLRPEGTGGDYLAECLAEYFLPGSERKLR